MKGAAAEVAVFADTDLGTRIAFNVPSHITAGAFKRDFEKVHFTCLPDIGEIQVHGLMVWRKSCFYSLPDSLPIKYVFPRMREMWFLHVEASHLKCLQVPCLPHDDAAVVSKHRDLTTYDCENENKTRYNSEEKKEEGLHPCAYLSEENEVISHVPNKKRNSHENYKQHEASGMSERYSCRSVDKSTSTASKSRCVMPENKVENRLELRANSMQESPSKMSTQVVSVSGIINKYFSGFNGINNFSTSSNSAVTSRVVHSEIEVQSHTRSQSCSKKKNVSLPQFTPKTPPHVLHGPLHVDLVSMKSGRKTRRSKVGKCSKTRKSIVGKRLLSASKSLGVSITKHSPALSFSKFKDKKLLEEKSQIRGSIFSICDSDDD